MSASEHMGHFLDLLHPEPRRDRLIEIRAIPRDRKNAEIVSLWIWDDVTAATVMARAVELNGYGYDIYASVNPRSSMGGKIVNVAGVSALPIDVDVFKSRVYFPHVVKRLEHFGLRPGIVSFSGRGGHAYILLDGIYPLADAVPAAKRLIQLTGGASDAVHSPAQVMRLPGTFNLKTEPAEACTILRADENARYSLQDVLERLEAAGVPALPNQATLNDVPIVGTPAADVAELLERVPLEIRLIIETGKTTATDASLLDWSICCCLVTLGGSDEQIRTIYETMPVRQIKAERAGSAYFDRTLTRARRHIATDIEADSTGARLVSSGLFYENGGDVVPDADACRGALERLFWAGSRQSRMN